MITIRKIKRKEYERIENLTRIEDLDIIINKMAGDNSNYGINFERLFKNLKIWQRIDIVPDKEQAMAKAKEIAEVLNKKEIFIEIEEVKQND